MTTHRYGGARRALLALTVLVAAVCSEAPTAVAPARSIDLALNRPVLAATLIMLFLDRVAGTSFFVPDMLVVGGAISAGAGAPPDQSHELPPEGVSRFGTTEWVVRSRPLDSPPLAPATTADPRWKTAPSSGLP